MLQQMQRALPGLRLVLVVEAEHQQRAEAADLVPDLLDLLGDRVGRADDPVVLGAIVDRDVAVGHLGLVLQILEEAEVAEQREEVLTHHAAHRAGRELPRLLVGVGDEHLAHQAPVVAVRRAPALGGALHHGVPMAGDIGRVEVEAERDAAELAGELQRVGVLAQPGDADRRMRRLQRVEVGVQDIEHLGGLGRRPVLAL